jgi:NhaA family Na+:H+ antiporter
VVRRAPGEGPGLAEHFEHRWRPLSAGVAVPVFAFFAAGVSVAGGDAFADPVTVGVVAGLLIGKTAGILGATWLVARFTRATLDEGLAWVDVLGLALLGGVGFTVSLLIGELAYGAGSAHDQHTKLAVLIGSTTAALLATVLLRLRDQAYRRLSAAETTDSDADGVPDGYDEHDR